MTKLPTRRAFLSAAPLVAASTLPFAESMLHASTLAAAGEQSAAPPAKFELFSAETLATMAKALEAAPGNKPLIGGKGIGISATLTVETKKAAKEFEYHEHRDHVVLILDGSTRYFVGGTPKDPHQTGPGEFLAPDSEGFTTYELKKGDMLSLPRTTPHKRVTGDTVTLILINGIAP